MLVSTALVRCFTFDDGFNIGQIKVTKSSINIVGIPATSYEGPMDSISMKISNQVSLMPTNKCALISPKEFSCKADKLQHCSSYKFCITYPLTYFVKRTRCRSVTTTGCKEHIVTAETKLEADDGFNLVAINATKSSIDIAVTTAFSTTRTAYGVNMKISNGDNYLTMSKCDMFTTTNFTCNAMKLTPCTSYEFCITVQETSLLNKTKCRNITTYGCKKDIVTSDTIGEIGFELGTTSVTERTIDIFGNTVNIANGMEGRFKMEISTEFSGVSKSTCEIFSPTEFKCSAKKLKPCTSYKTCITYQYTSSMKRTVCSTSKTTGCKKITITAYSKFDADSGFGLDAVRITSTTIDIVSKKPKTTMPATIA
jgi:hypothetical protein